MILLIEHTELLLIIGNNNKDYMSLGIGMCIFSQMYLIVKKIFFFKLYFIYLLFRQTMITVGMIRRQ